MRSDYRGGRIARHRPSGEGARSVTFSTEEIVALVIIGVLLAIVVTAYMVISRRKGWM